MACLSGIIHRCFAFCAKPAEPENLEEPLILEDTTEVIPPKMWDQFAVWSKSQSRSLNPILFMFLLGREAGHALDLGCGIGDNTHLLLQQNWSVTAVDVSAKAIEILAQLKNRRLESVCSPLEEYPFDKKTNLVLAINVLGFCAPSKIKEIWSRIYQCLPKGGHIICTLPVPKGLGNWHLDKPAMDQLFIRKQFKVIQSVDLKDPEASHPLALVLQKI